MNSNQRKGRHSNIKEVPSESDLLLLTLAKTDEYGYTSRFKYTYNFDSCIMTVKPTPECSKYYKNVTKFKITPNRSIEFVDYRNCKMRLLVKDGLIKEISEEWDKGNSWPIHYDEDGHMVKWYSRVATWDKDVLSQVKTIIYDWVSINDYVPYKKVYNGSNYARPSPDFLKEMFYMNEDEIIFVYIGLYGKLPKTISRYTIDTHDVYTYVYTATWSDCGTRQVIRKQKVGSERFSEVCYDWEIDNIDLFRAAFNRHEGG